MNRAERGGLPADHCGDCAAPPGAPHVDGCDVARCTECGWQRISCEHGDADVGWGQVWTGAWPGLAECREWGLWCVEFRNGRWWVPCDPDDPEAREDLNRLATMAAQGIVQWSVEEQRWVKP